MGTPCVWCGNPPCSTAGFDRRIYCKVALPTHENCTMVRKKSGGGLTAKEAYDWVLEVDEWAQGVLGCGVWPDGVRRSVRAFDLRQLLGECLV